LEYGTETAYLEAEGRVLNQEETQSAIKEYLNELDIEEWVNIAFVKN